MKEVIARLKEHQSPTPSKWRERAEWRQQNKSWLRHSQRIAVKMLEKMDELGLTQKQLAELMGCSQESFSRNHVEDRRLSAHFYSQRRVGDGISNHNLKWHGDR